MLRGNRGQTEIIGLLLVVLIVTFAIVFALVFFAKPKSFMVGNERLLANDFIEASLALNTDCFGMKVEDLLNDCSQSGGVGRICPEASQFKGKGTCQVAELVMNDLIKKTFGKWQIRHNLSISGSSPLVKFVFPCNFKSCKKFETGFRAISYRGMEYIITLQICRDVSDPSEKACV